MYLLILLWWETNFLFFSIICSNHCPTRFMMYFLILKQTFLIHQMLVTWQNTGYINMYSRKSGKVVSFPSPALDMSFDLEQVTEICSASLKWEKIELSGLPHKTTRYRITNSTNIRSWCYRCCCLFFLWHILKIV